MKQPKTLPIAEAAPLGIGFEDRFSGSGGSKPVPTYIAVCPECGSQIKWYIVNSPEVCCFCPGAKHAPEQTKEMLSKWIGVEAAVTDWLKQLPLNAELSRGDSAPTP